MRHSLIHTTKLNDAAPLTANFLKNPRSINSWIHYSGMILVQGYYQLFSFSGFQQNHFTFLLLWIACELINIFGPYRVDISVNKSFDHVSMEGYYIKRGRCLLSNKYQVYQMDITPKTSTSLQIWIKFQCLVYPRENRVRCTSSPLGAFCYIFTCL